MCSMRAACALLHCVTWAKDFHNHLKSVQCQKLNVKFTNQQNQTNKIVQFELYRIQFALFEKLLIPYDKNPLKQVLRLNLERLSFKLELYSYPEIALRMRNVWVKMLFNVGKTIEETRVEKIKITFGLLEWDDEFHTDMKGETDAATTVKMRVGIKEMEPGFAKAFTVIFKNNYERMYDFLKNNEFENYNFGEFLKLIFENYNEKTKIMKIDSEWLRSLVEVKEQVEKEIHEKVSEGKWDEKEKVKQMKKENKKDDL